MNRNSSASGFESQQNDCITSLLTLQGPFTLFNADNQSILYNNATGATVVKGCAQSIVANASRMSAQLLSSSTPPATLEPFWDSISPLILAVAVAITLSYILLLISLMARTKRPWLQRCAAFSAIVPLTLAVDLMWKELQRQQSSMTFYDSSRVRDVRANTALKVLRLIANALLWLAQVQVLIRLFPRHRDKVIIKWCGLCLIVLQTTFAVLNDFFHPSPLNPTSTNALIPAIPVLSYLFHIALGTLYAVCVVFYSITNDRWRYAYRLPVILNAIASIVCIVCPVLFFCLDIWDQRVDGWGDYVRIASMVAASVVTWDWVNLIETSIHKDSNSGVLGREVFEDEMNDGRPKKHRNDLDKKRRLIPHTWRARISNAANAKSAKEEVELPVIRHPFIHSSSMSSTSVPSEDTTAPLPAPRAGTTNSLITSHSYLAPSEMHAGSMFDRPRDLMQEYALQWGIQNPSTCDSSRTIQEAVRPQSSHSLHGNLDRNTRPQAPAENRHSRGGSYPYAGFQPGDYWPDRKSHDQAPET